MAQRSDGARHGAPDDAAASSTVAVVLAAGGGTRFEGPGHKLTARLGDRSIAEHAVRAALDADVGTVVVVTGAVADPVPALAAEPRLRLVHNDRWADGQAGSLQMGVRTAAELGADAVVVGLADQPFVTAGAWRRVAASTAPIAIATYGGHRRNPVRLHREVWPLLPNEGDLGARAVARLRPDLVEEVPCAGSAADIDTREDLRRWNRSSTNSP
jgi:CTP:molybdopterin cytidylyltransferase MocA